MSEVKLGFIGTGGIARHHMKHLSQWKDVKMAAFFDVNAEAATKQANEHKGTAYTDVDRMLDTEKLDAVYICVPPFAHGAELAAIKRKIPVFVEKPLGTTLAQAAEINEAIKKAKIVSGVGYNWRASSATKKAKEIMAGKAVSAAYGYWVGGFPGVMWWRQQAQSGGQLNEQTTHVVDIARYLIGSKVKKIYAQGNKGIYSKKHEKHDVADNSIAVLTFENGVVCSIASGHLSNQNFRVGIDFILEDLTVTHNDNELRVKHPAGEEVYKTTNKAYEDEDRAFLEAVKKKDPKGVFCDYADAFETHRICMAGNESMETGKVVTLE